MLFIFLAPRRLAKLRKIPSVALSGPAIIIANFRPVNFLAIRRIVERTRNNVQNPNEFIRLNQYEQTDYFANQIFGNYKLTKNEKHLLNGCLSFKKTSYKKHDRKIVTGTKINKCKINYSVIS